MSVYKNSDDTIRISLFKLHSDPTGDIAGKLIGWDADVFQKGGETITFSHTGDYFSTKGEAKAWYIQIYGALKSIQPKGSMTQGWRSK